jgi:tetratricopeptide (TPR) repeat protein
MRSGLLLLLVAPLLVAWSFFDPFHENVEKGNRAAEAGTAAEALERYEEAARVEPGSPIPDFNRGIVLGAEGEADAARDAYLAAAAAEDPAIAADALYNLGNLHLARNEFEPAIDSYLRSLDLDPEDAEARRNLEIALQRQEEQQQQQQDQQQQDQEQDQEQDEEQDQQQPQEPEEPSEDEQQQNETPQPQEEEQEPEQEPQPEERFTREDAERLLNAIQSDELKVLEQLQPEQPSPGDSPYDW